MANAGFWLGFMLPMLCLWVAFLWEVRKRKREREARETRPIVRLDDRGQTALHRVVVFRPGEDPVVEGVECFEEIRDKLLRGYVERVRFGRYDALVDEDGRLKHLPLNRRVDGRWIVGTFVVTKLGDDGIEDLGTEDIELIFARAAMEAWALS